MAVYLTTVLWASEAAACVGACKRCPAPPWLSLSRLPHFPCRRVGTTRAWLVFIPRSIDEKRAGGFPGAIEALEVWTLQLEFHSARCHLYNRVQAQNIFSFNISDLICHNIWQWIQLTSLLPQQELLAHHLQQLYFSRLSTGLWGVIVLKCEH